MQTYFDTAATDVVAQASTLNPGLNVSMWNIIAALAAVLSAVQLIPQARNALKADELNGISLTTFLIISFTTLLWMVYGIHLEDIAIIGANGIACLCALTVSLMKIRSGSVVNRVPGTGFISRYGERLARARGGSMSRPSRLSAVSPAHVSPRRSDPLPGTGFKLDGR